LDCLDLGETLSIKESINQIVVLAANRLWSLSVAVGIQRESHQAGRFKFPSAAGQVQSLYRDLQQGASSLSPGHEVSCRGLSALDAHLPRIADIDYPFRDKVTVVANCGHICLGHKKANFSTVFAGQAVGIKEVHDDIWLVSFMDYDLEYFDLETRVLDTRSARGCSLCDRYVV
jgi:hypothetical protein